MKIVKKDLKLTLEEKGINIKDLYTGNILTYSGTNHSGSFIGSASAGPVIIFVKDEKGYFQPLTNKLWGTYHESYMTIDQHPMYVDSIVINPKLLVDHLDQYCISYNKINTLKDLFKNLKNLNSLENERKPR